MRPAVGSDQILKFSEGAWEHVPDLLASEEPMEIRLEFGPQQERQRQAIAVTMRTPGADFELAAGFLFTEGIIAHQDEIASMRYCTDGGRKEDHENMVNVSLQSEVVPEIGSVVRNFYTTSSCGVCGKGSIESVRTRCRVVSGTAELNVAAETILALPQLLRDQQRVFAYTGGIHACALFDLRGQLLMVREDVGRHNALDKLIGAALLNGMIPLDKHLLLLSGRASFELVQKAAMAGIRFIAAVGAPSDLAVTTAREFDMTLLGFVRENRFNVYNGEHRLKK
ncbi:MAG: formate dehydrogenase accessory sulfurtransferase FdhD [Flavobacteriales bacterium]